MIQPLMTSARWIGSTREMSNSVSNLIYFPSPDYYVGKAVSSDESSIVVNSKFANSARLLSLQSPISTPSVQTSPVILVPVNQSRTLFMFEDTMTWVSGVSINMGNYCPFRCLLSKRVALDGTSQPSIRRLKIQWTKRSSSNYDLNQSVYYFSDGSFVVRTESGTSVGKIFFWELSSIAPKLQSLFPVLVVHMNHVQKSRGAAILNIQQRSSRSLVNYGSFRLGYLRWSWHCNL
jgi:hypothetical protein